MTGTGRLLLLITVLLLASGCTGKPVFSVEVYSTPAPSQSVIDPLPATTGTQPVLATAAWPGATLQAFTAAPAAIPSDFSPILYGEKYDANTFFFLLGGVREGKWLNPEQAVTIFQGTIEYDVYTSTGETFQVLGYAPESAPIRPGQYTIGTDAAHDQPGMLGVAHGWPVRLGDAQELSPNHEMYRQVVLDWLKEAGLSDPKLDTLQIFKVDLEGDGADEILLSASHMDKVKQFSQAEDYSVVLLRKVAGNKAVTLPIVADFYRPKLGEVIQPRIFSLTNFVDLNQDETLEIVVGYHRWEEDGALLYTVNGQEITQIP